MFELRSTTDQITLKRNNVFKVNESRSLFRLLDKPEVLELEAYWALNYIREAPLILPIVGQVDLHTIESPIRARIGICQYDFSGFPDNLRSRHWYPVCRI